MQIFSFNTFFPQQQISNKHLLVGKIIVREFTGIAQDLCIGVWIYILLLGYKISNFQGE